MAAAPVDVRPLRPQDWDLLVGFFGPSGAYSSCWCVWWRRSAAEFSAGCRDGGVGNRALLHRLTEDGRVPGLVAYDASLGTPVGWTSVAPRPDFPRLLRSPALQPRPDDGRGSPDDDRVWALPCFWVPRGGRRRGIGTALLAGAVDHAAVNGATAVEAYPVQPKDGAAAADLFTGTVPMFRRAGFSTVREPAPGTRRYVVRREL